MKTVGRLLIWSLLIAAVLIVEGVSQAATVPAGSQPRAVALNPVTNKIYVANYGDGTVTVIDGATNTTQTVTVGSSPYALAVNAVTNKIYVANYYSNSLTVIDGATNGTSTVSNVGTYPYAVAVNSVTNKIYLTNAGTSDVTVIDGVTNSVTRLTTVASAGGVLAVNPVTNKIYFCSGNTVTVLNGADNSTITVNAGWGPLAIAVNPVTNTIYAAGYGNDTLTVINGASGTSQVLTGIVGRSPSRVVVNPVTDRVYVLNSIDRTVSVIDGSTNSSIATVATPYPTEITVNPMTNTVYVANQGDNSITLIDGATNVAATVGLGQLYPYAVAVNPVTNKAYVPNYGSNDVSVIDGATNATSTVSAGTNPWFGDVNPVTNKIYVANAFGDNVTVIDGATNTPTTITDPNAINPWAVAVNPVTNKVYVANEKSNNVTVIDAANSNATTTVTAGTNPVALAVNPVTNKIYVANCGYGTNIECGSGSGPGNITVIDGATNTPTTITDPNAINPWAVAVNPVTNKIFVANYNSNNVTVINGATDTVVTTVGTGNNPVALAVNPVTNQIYVANETDGDVTVIDGTTYSTTAVDVESLPEAVAVNPVTNKVYVANFNSGSATVIDAANNNATTTISTGTNPYAVAANPVTNKIYVANYGSASVTVIDGTTNTTTTLTGISSPARVAVNPVTSTTYVSNWVSNDITVIAEEQVNTIPLAASITPLTGNATAVPTPSFDFSAASNFIPYGPTPSALYFQLDTWQGGWVPAPWQASGLFSATMPALLPGFHILYAYSTGGQYTTIGGNYGGSTSPLISNIAAYGFLVAPPVATLTPASLNFGNQTIGTPSTAQTLTLSASIAPLAIASIAITGPNSSDFSETNDCETSLFAGESCTINIIFTPTAQGAESATLTVTDDSGGVSGTTQSASLSGTGTIGSPSFSGLTPSQSIQAGTTSITLSGSISAGSYYPVGDSVSITIDGFPQSTMIGPGGSFSTTFTTSAIPASSTPYPITYSYPGDSTLLPASDASTALTVTAPPPNFTLNITAAIGTGSGTISDDGQGGQISCADSAGALSGTCSGSYPSGTYVTLTAAPASGSTFVSWGLACAGQTSNTCNLQMNMSFNVTANFALLPVSVNLLFNAGTNVSQTATICPNGSNPCTDPNAHAITLRIPNVITSFPLRVTATEFQADGLCPSGGNGQSPDFDCRLVNFFNYGTDSSGNAIVPHCYPYANGNCIHYAVDNGTAGGYPDPSLYSGGVYWKVGFMNTSYTPSSWWAGSTPRMLDDPDEDEVQGVPYGTICTSYMYVDNGGGSISPTPYFCQFDQDITTFYDPSPGLDPIGGKTKQTNDVVVAFPPTSVPTSNPTLPLPTPSAPTITGSCVSGCILNGNNITFTVGTGGAFLITPTGYPAPKIAITSGTVPPGLAFNPITGLISGTPTSAGTSSFTLTASNTLGQSTGTVSQTYSWTVNALGLSTTIMNFGTLYLGQVAARPMTLTNTGTTPITISSVKITGPGNALGDYGNISLCTSFFSKLPGILPPGKSCPIFVGILASAKIFSPLASTAMLSIIDNTVASPHLVQLTAQVINPKATLSTGSLAFPAQTVGTTSGPKTVTLTNTGNTPLTLGTPTVSGNFALASGTTCSSGTVAASSSCTISVTFAPTAKGTRTGNVKITDNALNSPQIISLSGTGK